MRVALTLFEVLISMTLLAIAVSTILLLLPRAHREQEKARFEVIGAAKALELLETFHCQPPLDRIGQIEVHPQTGDRANAANAYVGNPWDSNYAYWARSFDFEARLASRWGGLMPVPTGIARRLDSERDEIRSILDAGGQVYYAAPIPQIGQEITYATSGNGGLTGLYPPADGRKLVFGIVGHAQQNSMPALPWKAVPYYAPYPSPPEAAPEQKRDLYTRQVEQGTVLPDDESKLTEPNMYPSSGVNWYNGSSVVSQGVNQAGWAVYRANVRRAAFRPPNPTQVPTPTPPSGWPLPIPISPGSATLAYGIPVAAPPRPEQAKRYVALAWWFASRNGELPYDPWLSGRLATDQELEALLELSTPASERRGRNLRRLRFLAHATATLTRHYRPDLLGEDGNPAIMEDTGNTSDPDRSAVPYTPENLLSGVLIAATVHAAPTPADTADGLPKAALRSATSARFPDGRVYRDPAITWPSATAAIRFAVESREPYQVRVPNGPEGAAADVPVLNPDGTFPRITHDMIVNYQENCLRLAMKYATLCPYDWSEPRPANRAVMSDIPLLQADVLSPPLAGTIPLSPGNVAAQQWRPITPVDMTAWPSIGWQRTFASTPPAGRLVPRFRRHEGDTSTDASATWFDPNQAYTVPWGDHRNANLTAPFHPSQRCRQLVVWAVDWQSYEDAETAPGAPQDASRYPLFYPGGTRATTWTGRLAGNSWGWRANTFSYRHPELVALFTADVDDQHPNPALRAFRATDSAMPTMNSDHDRGNPYIFNGLLGADRNYNKVVDRGPLARSQRLTASLVARFDLYDPRLPMTMR